MGERRADFRILRFQRAAGCDRFLPSQKREVENVPVYLAVLKERDRGEAVAGEEAGRHPERGVDALDVIGCLYCVCS